jgi:hypothetical protein
MLFMMIEKKKGAKLARKDDQDVDKREREQVQLTWKVECTRGMTWNFDCDSHPTRMSRIVVYHKHPFKALPAK